MRERDDAAPTSHLLWVIPVTHTRHSYPSRCGPSLASTPSSKPHKYKPRKKSKTSPAGRNDSTASSVCEFLLRRHPHERAVEDLRFSVLRTPGHLKVVHMKKYLSTMLNVHHTKIIDIIFADQRANWTLDDSRSVRELLQVYCPSNEPLVLWYQVR